MIFQDWFMAVKAAADAQRQASDALDSANGQLAALLANPPAFPTPLEIKFEKGEPQLLLRITET